jgi:hypothetical protein
MSTTKELIGQVFENYQETIDNSPSSIFKKSDVRKLFNEIRYTVDAYLQRDEISKKSEEGFYIQKDRFDGFLDKIKECINESVDGLDVSDIVDDDDIDLEFDGREVIVDVTKINYESIKDAIVDGLEEFKSLWEEEIEEVNDENKSVQP